MKTSIVMLRGWMAASAFVWGATAAVAAQPVPVEAFFRMPDINQAEISPTGAHVALVVLNKEGRNQIVVVDTATLKPFVVAGSHDRDVGRVSWVNEKRLTYSVSEIMREPMTRVRLSGLYAVDIDGTERRPVISTSNLMGAATTKLVQGYYPYLYGTTWNKDSDKVFVAYPQHDSKFEMTSVQLKRVDSRTGESSVVEGPPGALGWYLGPGDAPVAAVVREGANQYSTQIYNRETHAWDKHLSYDIASRGEAFTVIGPADGDMVYVQNRPKGSENAALFTYNAKTRTMSPEPILSAKGFDLDPEVITSAGRVLGFRIETDAGSTVWFDPAMKKLQERVDALLPSTVNEIRVPQRATTPFVLVSASSDVAPARYFLFDTRAGKLVELGNSRTAIDPARMSPRDFVRYKARDGLEIPAWVTTPKDGKKGPRPMVVLVHGGPYMRGGHWSWNADSEFLASRGYVVLEPEFRGSEGFGRAHFRAGWKQWGLAMQNDVADGARWAIAQGIADPKRICIAGASYGGYATLMGLVNDPDLYRCGIDWVGVTDIELLYTIHWGDTSDAYRTYGMPVLVADREKDAAQIKATSPIHQAARIKAPLLLAYGGVDQRVPIKHGTDFRDAVKHTNPDVEWVEYPDEGHGWSALKSNIDFWTRVENFLARNIGDGATQ